MPKNFDMKGFEQLGNDLQKLRDKAPKTIESITKNLTARLYNLTVKNTPVGNYDDTFELEIDGDKKVLVLSSKQGGTLIKGWITKGPYYFGDNYICELINPVEYAPYVEYGHYQQRGRYVPAIGKNLSKSWVKGRFMLTKSLKELEKAAPKVIEKKIDKMMKDTFK